MDLKKIFFAICLAATGLAALLSYIFHLTPKGKQNQRTLILVIVTAVLTGLTGFLFAIWGLRGNVTAQQQFFIPIVTLVLLPTCIISATVAANQLYGLREAIAAGKQT
jgi:hypothetical protein